LCVTCRKPVDQDRKRYHLCWKCSLKKRITGITLEQLIDLFDNQKGKCPYSGEQLDISTAHLDHKTSRARGGSNSIDNLQWVAPWVNWMKRDYSEDEFLSMVEKIHKHTFRIRGLT
jgi:5-methylcytosine-specific restriction endonuclease McrA